MNLRMFLFLLIPHCFGQIIHNGDFENGAKDPWICRGCQGHVKGPGHNSANSFYADHRTASWNGPAQFLNIEEVNALDILDVTLSFSLMPDEDVDIFWKLMFEDENGKHVETLFEGSFSSETWETVSQKISLSPLIRSASVIDLYMEGFPETASWRIDDISLVTGDVQSTTPVITTTLVDTTTISGNPPYVGNILQNGDFESGIDPWTCNGCEGSVGSPAHSGVNSFIANERRARWAGPHQVIDTNVVNSISKFNLAFNFSIFSEEEKLSEYIWKITVTKNGETKYYDLHHGSVVSNEWQTTFTYITLPEFAHNAEHIELYLEAFPEHTSFRIDDVFLYDEDASDWISEANSRIDAIRKNNVNLAFVFQDDAPEDLSLEINQQTHQFAFGSAVQSIQISQCLGGNTPYCSFAKDNFNFMTDTYRMKWPEQEPVQGELNIDSMEVVDRFIEWASEHDMQVRGHSLLWARSGNNPEWVGNLEGDALIDAMKSRVDTAVALYDGLVPHWDVNNEMIGNNFYVDKTGDPTIRAKMFNRAKELSPDTLLFVNEYGVLLDKYGRFEAFQVLLRELLSQGANIDAIGLQGHITEDDLADVSTIKLHLDQIWEEFKLPIWITEFTFNVGGEIHDPDHKIHAEQVENFYRIALSHEVKSFTLCWFSSIIALIYRLFME